MRRSGLWSRPGCRAAEERLDQVVRGLVPDPDQRSRVRTRRRGSRGGSRWRDGSRVAAVRERLLARRYGPPGQTGRRPGSGTGGGRAGTPPGRFVARVAEDGCAPIVLLLGLFSAGMYAQAPPPPEGLYEAGALQAAADGFSRRAALEPTVAAHWYDLGAAYYRLGAKGRATAAWVQARRLAPREPNVLRALRLTPAPDADFGQDGSGSPPVTPEELLLAGGVGLVCRLDRVGAAAANARPLAVLLVFAAVAALGGLGLRVWYHRPVAVVLDQTTMRFSPHGRAPAVGPLESGAAVRMVRDDRGWVLVRSGRARGLGYVGRDRRNQRVNCPNATPHCHSARRRRRSDCRGRSGRASSLRGEGAGGERARCRSPSHPGGAGERGKGPDRSQRRRQRDGAGRRGTRARSARHQQSPFCGGPGRRLHLRFPGRGAARDSLGVAPYAEHHRRHR